MPHIIERRNRSPAIQPAPAATSPVIQAAPGEHTHASAGDGPHSHSHSHGDQFGKRRPTPPDAPPPPLPTIELGTSGREYTLEDLKKHIADDCHFEDFPVLTRLQAEHPKLFGEVFTVQSGHIRVNPGARPEQISRATEFIKKSIAAGAAPGFERGFLGKMMASLGEYLPVVGDHYDDLYKYFQRAFGIAKPVTYASTQDTHDHDHAHEAEDPLHIHGHKPPGETAVVLGMALATAFLVDKTNKKLPYPLQIGLKTLGAWPLYRHLIHGEMVHAIDDVKGLLPGATPSIGPDGKKKKVELDGLVHQTLIGGLLLLGVLSRKHSTHAMAAGGGMAAIMNVMGQFNKDKHDASLEAQQKIRDGLPGVANRVKGTDPSADSTEEVPVAELKEGDYVDVRTGEKLPCDAQLVAVTFGPKSPNGTLKVDSPLTSGGRNVDVEAGKQLDQGTRISTPDVVARFRVTRPFSESIVVQMLEQQNKIPLSDKQSGVKTFASRWVYGTLAATILVGIKNLLVPLLQKKNFSFHKALEPIANTAIMGSPCSIYSATGVETFTRRSLMQAANIQPLSGRAISNAAAVTDIVLDFTNTCTKDVTFEDVVFFEGKKELSKKKSLELFFHAAAVNQMSGSQHTNQLAMWQKTYEELGDDAEALRSHIKDCEIRPNQGVLGKYDNDDVRVGVEELVFGENKLPDKHPLKDYVARKDYVAKHKNQSWKFAYVKVGDKVGVIRFTPGGLRDGTEAGILAAQAQKLNVHILSGDSDGAQILKMAKDLNIPADQIHYGRDPLQKREYIAQLQAKGKKVMMVGDEYNDGPAMDKADCSAAMSDKYNRALRMQLDYLVPDLASISPLLEMARNVQKASDRTLYAAVAFTGLSALASASDIKRIPVLLASLIHEGFAGGVFAYGWHRGKKEVEELVNKRNALLVQRIAPAA